MARGVTRRGWIIAYQNTICELAQGRLPAEGEQPLQKHRG